MVKVGDKVRIKDGIVVGHMYGGYVYNSDIKKLKNKTLIVDKVFMETFTVEGFKLCLTEPMVDRVSDVSSNNTISKKNNTIKDKFLNSLENGQMLVLKDSSEILSRFIVVELNKDNCKWWGIGVDEYIKIDDFTFKDGIFNSLTRKLVEHYSVTNRISQTLNKYNKAERTLITKYDWIDDLKVDDLVEVEDKGNTYLAYYFKNGKVFKNGSTSKTSCGLITTVDKIIRKIED